MSTGLAPGVFCRPLTPSGPLSLLPSNASGAQGSGGTPSWLGTCQGRHAPVQHLPPVPRDSTDPQRVKRHMLPKPFWNNPSFYVVPQGPVLSYSKLFGKGGLCVTTQGLMHSKFCVVLSNKPQHSLRPRQLVVPRLNKLIPRSW